MKFKGHFDAECVDHACAGSRSNAMSCQAGKRKRHVEDDMDLDDDYLDGGDSGADLDDIDTDSLLDQFDDDIEGVDLSDLDLEDFAGEFGDDDLDDFDDDFDGDIDSRRSGGSKRRRDDDLDDIADDDLDDSSFYNDDFKDFDNYTTVSDFDDDLDTYIENEDGGGFYDDYDSRY
ncbi:MAG: hypothetical protein J5595_03555 [Bacteroidales bacterium]|nr:hypothetical protein [Bacteroidales bacterium]